MKKKTKTTIYIILGIVAILGLYLMLMDKPITSTEKQGPTGLGPMLVIDSTYDLYGNPINHPMSVVGGVEGVKYIKLKINIQNKDTVALNLSVSSMTPTEIVSAKPTNTVIVQPSTTGSLLTGLIDIEPYEGKSQNFCITVVSGRIPSLRESASTSGCINISVQPNPTGSFNIILESSVGNGTILNPGCTENWQCGSWGTCTSSLQTRTCTDLNSCGTLANKPVEQQTCAFITDCNSANVGIRKCYSSTKYQTCLSSGSWSGTLSCPNACTGQGVCS